MLRTAIPVGTALERLPPTKSRDPGAAGVPTNNPPSFVIPALRAFAVLAADPRTMGERTTPSATISGHPLNRLGMLPLSPMPPPNCLPTSDITKLYGLVHRVKNRYTRQHSSWTSDGLEIPVSSTRSPIFQDPTGLFCIRNVRWNHL